MPLIKNYPKKNYSKIIDDVYSLRLIEYWWVVLIDDWLSMFGCFDISQYKAEYQIDDEQYILINATGSFSLKKGYPSLVEFGNKILVFKIKKWKMF